MAKVVYYLFQPMRFRYGRLHPIEGGGATLISIGNAAIEPERIKEIEFGIDAELFNIFSLELTFIYKIG